jgi:hypothetical protein
MDYDIEFEEVHDYLKVTVTGTNSRETVQAYLGAMRKECLEREIFRVLIDEQLQGPRLPVMDVFAIASQGSIGALGEFDAIAYVDRNMGALGEFAETVAVNRGMPIAFFGSVEEAESWLLKQEPGVGDQDIFRGDSPDA